jgi:predicted ATPase
VSTFLGREQELRSLKKILNHARIVTLTGVGGVGKTRLALQLAAEMLPDYPDGAWLCELAAVRDDTAVQAAAAEVFGVGARPGETAAQTLASYLRDKRLLLILDNCEHVLDASADLVSQLARGAGVTLVLTGREPLGVEGERVFVVEPFDLPNADADPDIVPLSTAVALFAVRATAARADFELTAANAAAVGEICRRLDGIPLAIELAAARTGGIAPVELARRLDQRLRILDGGRRGLARHQTLRAAIDWSFDLLRPAEQTVLARLAVFVGGCSLEAAEAIAAGGDIDQSEVLGLMVSLVSKSLVVSYGQDGPEAHYRLLETVREYAAEQLDKRAEGDATRASHGRYFASWADQASTRLRTANEAWWTGLVQREQENLRAAMAWAIRAEDADVALRLLAAAERLPMFFLPVAGILGASGEAAASLPGATGRAECAAALVMAATHAWGTGDLERGRQLSASAAAAESRLGLPPDPYRLSATALLAIGDGRIADGIDIWAQTIPADVERDLIIDLGMDRAMVALYRTLNNEPGPWRAEAEEGLRIARATGTPTAISLCLGNLGYVVASDDLTAAYAAFNECLETTAGLGRTDGQAHGLFALAATRAGDGNTAVSQAAQAIEHRFWFPDRLSLGAVFGVLAHALADRRAEDAAVLLGASDALQSGYGEFAHLKALRSETTRRLAAGTEAIDLKAKIAIGAAMTNDQAAAWSKRVCSDFV